MEDFTLVWHDASEEMPEYMDIVLVVTEDNDFAVARFVHMIPRNEWHLMVNTCDGETWDADKNGKIAYWAYLPNLPDTNGYD